MRIASNKCTIIGTYSVKTLPITALVVTRANHFPVGVTLLK